MKTMIPFGRTMRGILFCSALLLAISSGTAWATVTTTLLSEDFSDNHVPPPGWSADHVWDWWTPGSYWSHDGYGGNNGSWAFNVWNCEHDNIYTPKLNLSGYDPATDNVYVDFDFYMEYNWYDRQQLLAHGHGGAQFEVFADNGTGNISSHVLLDYSYSDDHFTDDNHTSTFHRSDPSTSTGNWRHIRLQIPSGYWSSAFRVVFYAEPNSHLGYCRNGLIAFDNVVVTAQQPQSLAYEPSALDFGEIVLSTESHSQCVDITNNSNAPLSIASAVVAGDNPEDFTITGEVPETIDAFATISVCVTFAPLADAPRAAELVIANGSDNYPVLSIPLTGLGVAPIVELIPLEAHNTPTRLFSQVFVMLGDTLEQTMLVKNAGDGHLKVCHSTDITGEYPGEYFISQLPTTRLAAGEIDTLRVKYTPTMEGLHRAALNVVSNAINGTQVVDLNATGVLPKIVLDVNPLLFDSTILGEQVCKDVTVSNVGSDTLRILNQVISMNDGDFKFGLLAAENKAIAPGQSRVISVCFTPKQPGIRIAELTLFTNIPQTFEVNSSGGSGGPGFSSEPQYIRRDTSIVRLSISGTGVPKGALDVTDGGLDRMDSTIIGTQICHTGTIWNNGDADIRVTGVTVTGANASEFVVTPLAFPIVIRARSSHPIEICATPSMRGIREAVLHVTATTVDLTLNASMTLAVFGQEVCASYAPNITEPLFLDHKVIKNSDSTLCIEVTNCGDVATTFSAHLSDETYYSVTPVRPMLLQPGEVKEFCVHFNPTVTGELSSQLTISSDHVAPVVVDLMGIGACANMTNHGFEVPSTNAGGHSRFTVTLENTGNYDFTLGAPVLAQANSAYWIVPPIPMVVPAGDHADVIIGYDPTAINTTYSATLTFPDGGPCTESMPVLTFTQTTGTEGVSQVTQQEGFVLGQNFPNPASNQSTFSFTTPREAAVSITLTDLNGNTVRPLISGRVSEGEHLVTLDLSTVASGMYLYTLQSDGVRLTRLLVLTK